MKTIMTTNIFLEPFWGVDVALEQFFGGIGAGTFLFSAILLLLWNDKYRPIARVAALVSPLFALLGLSFLVMHLEQPFKVFLAFFHFHPTSALSWGTWLQTIFIAVSIFYAYSWRKKYEADHNLALSRNIAKIGFPVALITAAYYGFLLMVYRAHPLWNTGPVVVMSLAGVVLTGISVVVLILAIFYQKEMLQEIKAYRTILIGAIVVQLFTVALWVIALYFGPGESNPLLMVLIQEYGLLFWGGAIVLGGCVPFLLESWAALRERASKSFSLFIPITSSLLILFGSALSRYLILIAEQ